MSDQQPILFDVIETAVDALMTVFDVPTPPVPVEIMLQRPKSGMWKEVNLSELSTTFINIKQRYSPRMSVARLLARYACASAWGTQYDLAAIGATDDGVRALARAILMPRAMIEGVSTANRTPALISLRFEVPEEDALQRLTDLGLTNAESS
jgi:hypothetical protein